MKKIIKYFTIFFASALFMLILSSNKASAAQGTFDTSKNNVSLSVYTDGIENNLYLKVTIKATRGFGSNTAQYLVCKLPEGVTTYDHTNAGTTCPGALWATYLVSGDMSTFNTKENGALADANPITRVYTVDTGIDISSVDRTANYVIFVRTTFCSVRVLNAEGYYDGGGCLYWHVPDENSKFASVMFKGSDVRDTDITDIEDEELQSMMDKVSDIVMSIVMPVLYAVIGVFLVVKGSILGFQIVKAADEPQVRQEKIGALKWLVIGVAIAYAATGLVHVVTGAISGAFDFS